MEENVGEKTNASVKRVTKERTVLFRSVGASAVMAVNVSVHVGRITRGDDVKKQFASLNVKMADHAYFPTSASAMRDFMVPTANNISAEDVVRMADSVWGPTNVAVSRATRGNGVK